MVEQAVEDGRGQGGVVVEDLRPVLEGAHGRSGRAEKNRRKAIDESPGGDYPTLISTVEIPSFQWILWYCPCAALRSPGAIGAAQGRNRGFKLGWGMPVDVV